MPIFNYKCNRCDKETEVILNKPPLFTLKCCEINCGGDLERVYLPPSKVIINGYSEKNGYSRKEQ